MDKSEMLPLLFRMLKRLGMEVPAQEIPGLVRKYLDSQEAWEREFGPGTEIAQVGSFVRLPDALLGKHGLPVPSSVMVLAAFEKFQVLCAPISLVDRWPNPFPDGVLWLRKAQSPFLSRVLVDLRCTVAFSIPTLAANGQVLARIAKIPEDQVYTNHAGTFDITVEHRRTNEKWQRFADELAGSLPS